jgi:hypothetical protein
MYEDPQEFVNLALDTCEGQESKSVKTQAAKLFESLADNINGALTLTTFFSLQFINVSCCAESGKQPLDLSNFLGVIKAEHLELVQRCAYITNSK